MKSLIIASLFASVTFIAVQAQDTTTEEKDFTTVYCTDSNEAETCGPLATELGMEVCCANIYVRSDSSTGRVRHNRNECVPRYLAEQVPI